MRISEALAELERLGTEQNRKVYRRHGAPEPMYGVSYGERRKLAKRIGRDQALANRLFDSGNLDARLLAIDIADLGAMSSAQLDRWVSELSGAMLADELARALAPVGGALAFHKAMEWTRSEEEWIGRAGWSLLALLATYQPELDEEVLSERIDAIARQIHGAKNRTRDAMNGALIAIGARGGRLEQRALETARAIGKVEVDHGETGCKTPDAEAYIRRMIARRLPATDASPRKRPPRRGGARKTRSTSRI